MALFSQRMGFTPLTKMIQKDGIDDDLRVAIINALTEEIWQRWDYGIYSGNRDEIIKLAQKIWVEFFKKLLHEFPDSNIKNSLTDRYRNRWYPIIQDFCQTCDWCRLYDLVEFISKNIKEDWYLGLEQAINHALAKENSAYRLIHKEIVEITDNHEIEEIQSALDEAISPTKAHLEQSLKFLSDRKNPDYRNAIKEAISAIESDMKWITGKPNASLADGIRALKENKSMRSTFEQALTKLYAYTNDGSGIRHALLEEDADDISYSDAKFMFIICVSFHNYLVALIAENKITIPQPS